MATPYHAFPNGHGDSIQRWIEHGIQPGSFFTAVLCNDLKESCACADDFNRHALFEIVSWLYRYAPIGSWGSTEAVRTWSGHRGMSGRVEHMERLRAAMIEEGA